MKIEDETKKDIIDMLKRCAFRELCDQYFAKEFHWTIKGSSVLSGEYHNKEEFFNKVIYRLNAIILPGWKMHILNTHTCAETLVVEMRGEAKTKSGSTYNNEYCWILSFSNNKIISVTAYYDSLLVNKILA